MMIKELVRDEIKDLTPYVVVPKEEAKKIILDGNENPYQMPLEIMEKFTERLLQMELNRYPDAGCNNLRKKIASYLGQGINAEQILVGNGSDEVLQHLVQTFIQPNEKVLCLQPTFSMYKVFTKIGGGILVGFQLEEDGTLDLNNFWQAVKRVQPKMIFLCSPNNPTGGKIPLLTIAEIVKEFKGILVVDEAYGEFCQDSIISMLDQFPNLCVTRTFSKAIGLAGIRLGYLVGNKPLIQEVKKVILPYNVNAISQMMGEVILDNESLIRERVEKILEERERLRSLLEQHNGWYVYPSEANFLFLRGKDIPALANSFEEVGIQIRKFSGDFKDAIRITVGTPEENDQVCRVVLSFIERGEKNGTQM